MLRSALPCLITLTLQFALTTSARADFFQNTLTPFASSELVFADRYFIDQPATDIGFEAADKFNNVSVNSGTQGLKITWWGAAADPAIPGSTFGIRFYNINGPANNSATPPSQGPFYAGGVSSPTTTFLGNVVHQDAGSLSFYRYEAIIAAPSLNAGTEYFLSIYETDNNSGPGEFNDPSEKGWRWISANDILVGDEFQRDFGLGNAGPWLVGAPNDLYGRAFTLETVSLSVPEPSSLALLGLLGGLGAYRRRRNLAKKQLAETTV